jgi:hypothetical protein
MRTWILGVCLAAVTAAGVYSVLSGSLHSASCRPCAAVPAEPEPQPGPPPDAPLVHVVDVPALLAPPAVDPPKPTFVSFDEPPLAKPPARPAPEVIPAVFSEPATVEVAPAPRRAATPGPLPLATSEDPF